MPIGRPMVLDSGDTAWVLVASALVMLMTPGLALFYGGMVRAKNVLATLMACLVIMAVVSVQWALWGYSLAFAPSVGGLVGNLDFALLRGVDLAATPDGSTIPTGAFFVFQMMFAIITPVIILGAMAERVSLKGVALFSLLWATFVYDPVAHWVWGPGGWLGAFGALDFAGGLVVHVTSGVAALACAVYLGKRKFLSEPAGHNLTLVVLGAGLLWFGWFGFNAGSSLAADGLAAHALVVTHLAAAAGILGWGATEWMTKGKPSVLGAATGAIAGLVAITPAAGFVPAWSAMVIGVLAGVVCYGGVSLKRRLAFDDALDAFGVHGVGGVWGAVGTGLFAAVAVNGAGADGLAFDAASGVALLAAQLVGIGVVVLYTLLVTFALLKIVDLAVGLRVPEEAEQVGLDLFQHGETGYVIHAHAAAPVAASVALLATLEGEERP